MNGVAVVVAADAFAMRLGGGHEVRAGCGWVHERIDERGAVMHGEGQHLMAMDRLFRSGADGATHDVGDGAMHEACGTLQQGLSSALMRVSSPAWRGEPWQSPEAVVEVMPESHVARRCTTTANARQCDVHHKPRGTMPYLGMASSP